MKKEWFNPLICFLLSIFVLSAFSQNDKQRIAILDFTNTGGLTEEETVTLGNRLRSMLVQSNAYIVLERGKMEEILEEQGFQQSGCTTTECAVEMGQLLNVQKMVSGSFGKLGETYTIDLSLIDVETAQIEQSFFRDYKGEIDGLLEIMQIIANQISEIHKPEQKRLFKLVIDSDPPGARIMLNGRFAGETPFESKAREGVELTIWLQKDDYQDWQQKITITEDMEIEAELISKTSESGISSTWYWIGGGALVGGAAILLLSGNGSTDSKDGDNYPLPPGRP